MVVLFEELDYRQTPIGELSLRRRRFAQLDTDVFEVKLGDEFLMSSLFTVGERALAILGLGAADSTMLDVVVGGLGLGYTAAEVLKDKRVRSLRVIEYLDPVIDWHRRRLVPLGPTLTGDPRCELVEADFFELARSEHVSFDSRSPARQFHVVLLDIDHAPDRVLHPDNRTFYMAETLCRLSDAIVPGGVFAMWCDTSPDHIFLQLLQEVFGLARAEIVEFDHPLQSKKSSCTIYVASKQSS